MTWQDPSPEALLAGLDPDAGQAERHLWLIALIEWLRGPEADVPAMVLEAGFLSNPGDAARLAGAETRAAVAETLAKAVLAVVQASAVSGDAAVGGR